MKKYTVLGYERDNDCCFNSIYEHDDSQYCEFYPLMMRMKEFLEKEWKESWPRSEAKWDLEEDECDDLPFEEFDIVWAIDLATGEVSHAP